MTDKQSMINDNITKSIIRFINCDLYSTLKSKRQSAVECKEPLDWFYCVAYYFIRAFDTLMDMISVVVGDVIMEGRHKLEVESPDTEIDIKSSVN